MGDTFRPVAAMCAYAGLRLSEALGLRWRDVDLKGGVIEVSASRPGWDARAGEDRRSRSTVPPRQCSLPSSRPRLVRVAGVALARVRPDALVFTNVTAARTAARNVLRAVYAAGDAAWLNGAGVSRSACMTYVTRSSRWRSPQG